MSATRKTLVRDLRRLGLSKGQLVMMHVSVRSVGPVIGGPDEIHLAIEESICPGGTVMMYVGCQDGYDDVGRGDLAAEEERTILESQPPFDFQHSRAARDFGFMAELFRSYPGTFCSQSVCGRMAARGGSAAALLADHPWNYSFGDSSPLAKLCERGGKILLLGSGHDEVTFLHYVEHVAAFPGKRVARYKVPIDRDGERRWVDCEEFDTSGSGVHENWPPGAFARIVDSFIE